MLRVTEQSRPDLLELATFLAVASEESISGAARSLGLPKSTVSRRLSRLEEKLGIQLVQRTTRRLSLTYEGTIYRDRVALALGSLEEAHEAAREKQEVPRGHLRITAPIDLALARLVPLVTEFTSRYPETTVELLLTERIVDLVGEGIDLALRAVDRLEDSSLVARPLGIVELLLVATPGYLRRHGRPELPADLPGHRFVLRSCNQGRGLISLLGPEGESRQEVEVAVAGGDFTFVHRAILQEAGIGILPRMTAESDLASGRLERVLPDHLAGEARLFLVHAGGRLLSAKVRAFRELILEQKDWVEAFPAGV